MTVDQLIGLLAGAPFAIVVAVWLLLEMPRLRRAVEESTAEQREISGKIDHLIRLTEVQTGMRRRDQV